MPADAGAESDAGSDAGLDAGPADAGPADAGADAGVDAGFDAGLDAGPAGPAWPSNALRVEVLHTASLLASNTFCHLGDGGIVTRSTWSLELDSGVIDFAVCYPQEDLYVVDSGVLQPAQLAAFNAATAAMNIVPARTPPCSNDSDVDAYTITTATGVVLLQGSADHCPLPPGVFAVNNASGPRAVLEAATHP